MVLWVMRLSAKLNVFLGVPNLNEEFLPEHLRYLKSFLTKKPMNLLFPVSVTLATIVTRAGRAGCRGRRKRARSSRRRCTFLGTLLALAILEHWFLVLPLPDAALWSWILGARAEHAPQEADWHRCARSRLCDAGGTAGLSRAAIRAPRPSPSSPGAGLRPLPPRRSFSNQWEATMNYEAFFRDPARRPAPRRPLPRLRRPRAAGRATSPAPPITATAHRAAGDRLVLERLSRHGPAPQRARGHARGARPVRRRCRRHPQHLRHQPLPRAARARAGRPARQGGGAAVHLRLRLELGGTGHARLAACPAASCSPTQATMPR